MRRLGRSWRTCRALSRSQRRLFLRAWLWLPLVALSLRLGGFRRTRAWLGEPAVAPLREDLPAAQTVARILLSAARWSPVRASCLVRALTLCRLLRQQGLTAELRIGVAQPDGRFAAHAWVEHGGVALAEAAAIKERYVPFKFNPSIGDVTQS